MYIFDKLLCGFNSAGMVFRGIHKGLSAELDHALLLLPLEAVRAGTEVKTEAGRVEVEPEAGRIEVETEVKVGGYLKGRGRAGRIGETPLAQGTVVAAVAGHRVGWHETAAILNFGEERAAILILGVEGAHFMAPKCQQAVLFTSDLKRNKNLRFCVLM